MQVRDNGDLEGQGRENTKGKGSGGYLGYKMVMEWIQGMRLREELGMLCANVAVCTSGPEPVAISEKRTTKMTSFVVVGSAKSDFGPIRFEVPVRKSRSHISYEISYVKSGLETSTCESFVPAETEVSGKSESCRSEQRLGRGGGLGLRPRRTSRFDSQVTGEGQEEQAEK